MEKSHQVGVGLDVIGINADYSLDLDALERAITPATLLITISHASNVIGVVTPVQRSQKTATKKASSCLLMAPSQYLTCR